MSKTPKPPIEFDDDLSRAIADHADKLELEAKTPEGGTATKTSQYISAASSPEEERKFQAEVAMERARFLIVDEGADIEVAAKQLGIDPVVLKLRANQEGWLAERSRQRAMEERANDSSDTAAQNLALRDNFRQKLLKANQRLELIERAVHRRTLDAVGNTTEVQFTDMDGNSVTIRVPTAREGTFESLLALNKQIIDQANVLSNYVEPQAQAAAKRLRRSKANAMQRFKEDAERIRKGVDDAGEEGPAE